jgi:glycosyltransferase involved in cell wall biosynthesis
VVHNAVLPVPPPGDADESRRDVFSRLGIQQDRLLIVSAGRLSPEKGYGDLLRAIALMGPTASKCAFVVCGDGSLAPQLTKMARDLDLSKLVQFCGFRSDILEIFQAMDLFVLPSLTEGFPNVLLEAFACGKPAVATSVGGVPELVRHGENGILVPPSRPDLLGKAVADYVDSPNRRLTSGHAALRAVTSRFTFEKQTARLQAVYCELLSDSESSAIPTLSDDVSGSASTVL